MKKTALFIVSLILCITVFAQETKPCLFIGTYEKNKRGICGDYELIHEEIKDYADYNAKRNQFMEDHKSESPATRFVDKNENIIAYQYEKKISGWNCNSNVITIKVSKSIEECHKQLADHEAKYPKDFTTLPKIIFIWQGKVNSIVSYSEDFSGLSGKFTSGNTATKTIIVAQLTNNTKDMLAKVTLITDIGIETEELIQPGGTLTKKYDSKKLDITVKYLDSNSKSSTEVINRIKGGVRKIIINQEGTIKTVPPTASSGIRG